MSGNVCAAEQVKGERIAEERAQKATKFHEVATKYVEEPKAEKPINVYVKGTTSELDLSKKPFQDAGCKNIDFFPEVKMGSFSVSPISWNEYQKLAKKQVAYGHRLSVKRISRKKSN